MGDIKVRPLQFNTNGFTFGIACEYLIYKDSEGYNSVVYPINGEPFVVVHSVDKETAIAALNDHHKACVLECIDTKEKE